MGMITVVVMQIWTVVVVAGKHLHVSIMDSVEVDGVVVLHCEEEDKGHPVVVVVEVEVDGVEAKSNLMRKKKFRIWETMNLSMCV